MYGLILTDVWLFQKSETIIQTLFSAMYSSDLITGKYFVKFLLLHIVRSLVFTFKMLNFPCYCCFISLLNSWIYLLQCNKTLKPHNLIKAWEAITYTGKLFMSAIDIINTTAMNLWLYANRCTSSFTIHNVSRPWDFTGNLWATKNKFCG